MDAYDLKNDLASMWQRLVKMPNSADINKTYLEVPVYVNVDGNLKKVVSAVESDDKIILEIKNEQTTI